MNKDEFKQLIGEFSWNFSNEFFIETVMGNFIWSAPEYAGDNSVIRFNGSLQDYIESRNLPYVRDKGTHIIEDYIDDNFEFKG